MMLMRESTIMFLHYLTAIVIVITGLIHLLANNDPVIGPIIRDNTILYVGNMALFLAALLYHALNGARVILIEMIPNRCWTKWIGWGLLIIGIIVYAAGLQILMMSLGLI